MSTVVLAVVSLGISSRLGSRCTTILDFMEVLRRVWTDVAKFSTKMAILILHPDIKRKSLVSSLGGVDSVVRLIITG